MAKNENYNLDAMYEALKSFDNYTAPYEIEVTLELINSKLKNTESTIDELKSRTFYQGNDILDNLQTKLKDAKNYVTDSLVPVSRDLYTLKKLLKKRNDLKTTKKKSKKSKPYYDYNEGFYDYLVQYYVDNEDTDANCKISELQGVEFAIINLINEIKYKTMWEKTEAPPAIIPIPSPSVIVPTPTGAPLYGPPPTPTRTPTPTTIIPTMTGAPLYGAPMPTMTPIIPTMTIAPLYAPPPIPTIIVPVIPTMTIAPLYAPPPVPPTPTRPPTPSIIPIADTYEDIYGKPYDEAFEKSYEDLKPIYDEYELRPIGDTYEDIYGKQPKGKIADFEDKPRDIEIELKNKN